MKHRNYYDTDLTDINISNINISNMNIEDMDETETQDYPLREISLDMPIKRRKKGGGGEYSCLSFYA